MTATFIPSVFAVLKAPKKFIENEKQEQKPEEK
jgi:hypothetical protein